MSGTHIEITTTTTDRAHRTDDAVMTTIVVMTTIAAMTAATDIETTTMTVTMMTGMIGTIEETLATIGEMATEITAITEGITTTAAAMGKGTTVHLEITPQRTGREINFHNFQPPKEQKLATRQM